MFFCQNLPMVSHHPQALAWSGLLFCSSLSSTNLAQTIQCGDKILGFEARKMQIQISLLHYYKQWSRGFYLTFLSLVLLLCNLRIIIHTFGEMLYRLNEIFTNYRAKCPAYHRYCRHSISFNHIVFYLHIFSIVECEILSSFLTSIGPIFFPFKMGLGISI